MKTPSRIRDALVSHFADHQSIMTVPSPPLIPSRPGKRKHTPEASYQSQSSSLDTPPRPEISPRVTKKSRPKPVNAQALRAKTVSRLFAGQRSYDRGDVDVEMTSPDDGSCAFCEGTVDMGMGVPDEYLCLRCSRVVCGKCGVRQYLSEGDYVACLECIHAG